MKQKKSNPNIAVLFAAKYKKAKLKSVPFDCYIDPYMVFSDFFGVSNIKGHLLEFKKIYRSAASLRCVKATPASVIYDRELFSNLLNAAWVINQTGIRFSQINGKEHYKGLSGGELSGKKINCYLTDAEINDPYLGIKKVFNDNTLQKCHAALNEWLKMALCKNEFEEDYKGRRKLYKGIVKVLICCWLIYEREICVSTKVEEVAS